MCGTFVVRSGSGRLVIIMNYHGGLWHILLESNMYTCIVLSLITIVSLQVVMIWLAHKCYSSVSFVNPIVRERCSERFTAFRMNVRLCLVVYYCSYLLTHAFHVVALFDM